MGMAAFIILERGYFRTSLPSSVTEIGAFARNPSIHSIATKNSQASASEKKIVQELGKKYGCHHCGQRSFFGTNFIADHMPPNKIFADMPIRKRAMVSLLHVVYFIQNT